MLVLGRKVGEWLDVYENGEIVLSIVVSDIGRSSVRLGLDAEDRFRIIRREVKDKPEGKGGSDDGE